MYHIVNDRRAYKSAQRLLAALEDCLKQKKFDDICISEVCEASGVGRATFYRHFDNMTDMLSFQCHHIINVVVDSIEAEEHDSLSKACEKFIQAWMEHPLLLETLLSTNRLDILFQAHVDNMDSLYKAAKQIKHVDKQQFDYLFYMLSATIATTMRVWYMHGKDETAAELTQHLKENLRLLVKLL